MNSSWFVCPPADNGHEREVANGVRWKRRTKNALTCPREEFDGDQSASVSALNSAADRTEWNPMRKEEERKKKKGCSKVQEINKRDERC